MQQCIEYALEHNLSLSQSMLGLENAKLTQTQNYLLMAPNLNAGATHGYNVGRRIDPFTNQFANSTVRSNNFFISSSVTLFNGLQTQKTITQGNADYEATRFDVEKLKQDIALNVANAYLNVLFCYEVEANAKRQLEISSLQRKRVKVLTDEGALALGNLYDIDAQVAQEELNVVTAQNALNLAYLTLAQLMNFPDENQLQIARPAVEIPATNLLQSTAGSIYASAVDMQPDIKSAQLRQLSSQAQLGIARGTSMPQLTLSGSLGTGFSGLSKQLVGSPFITGFTPSGFTSGGDTVFTPEIGVETRTTPFGTQFKDNVNKNLSFNLSIPIFNQWQSRTAISRAKIALKNAELTTQIRKQGLERNVQQSYADAQAALNAYRANEKAVSAALESFTYAEKRYNAGAINAVDYTNSKTRLAQSQSNLVRAKYDLVFKLKVLELYQTGKLGVL